MIAERPQIANWPCTGWPKNYTFSSVHNTTVCLERLRRYVEFRMFGSSGPTGNMCSSSGPPCGHEKIRCFRLYIQSFTVPRILLLLHRIMLVVRRYEEAAIVQDIWRARFCTKPIPDRSHYTCDQLRSIFIHATRILSYSVWGVVHNRRNTENKLFAHSMQHCRT